MTIHWEKIFPLTLTEREWRWFGFCLAAALGTLSVHYLPGWWNGERTDLLVMYRPNLGDIDYYPLARQIGEGRFGEGFMAGKIGEGWIGFPGASVVFHGVALRVFGAVGFALADILTPAVYFLMGARFLMCAGSAPLPAMLTALCVALRGFSTLGDATIHFFGYALHGVPFYLTFLQSWELRFPRNFVSDIFVLGALAQWIEFARHGLPRRRSWWIGTAVWSALVLQSDIYSFAALGLTFAATLAGQIFTRRVRLEREWLAPAALAAGVFLALIAPFLIQRWQTSPDVLERFGVFKLARHHALTLAHRVSYYFPRTFIWGTLALPWIWCGLHRRTAGAVRTAAVLTILQLAGYAALPAFVGLTGQAVQLYHFRDAARSFVAWSALATLGLTFTAISRLAPVQRFTTRSAARMAGAVAVGAASVGMLFVLWQQAEDRRTWPGPIYRNSAHDPLPAWEKTYHADWAALASELDRSAYASARVLATADGELYSWWTGLHGGQSFLAQSFGSSLSNDTLLLRLNQFARLNQIDAGQFLPWVTGRGDTITWPLSHWFSSNLYGANALRAPFPAEDYTPEQRRAIAAVTDPLECWFLVVPPGEHRRLQRAFEAAATTPMPPLPDLMILTDEFPELRPNPELFTLVYRNPTFRIYRPSTQVRGE